MTTPEQPHSAWFEAVAGRYARYRPTYPDAFWEIYTAQLTAPAPVVWDCGCGNGQAALALAQRGVRVIGTDASAAQIDAAAPHPLIRYRQAPAEASGLEAASIDGVLVAMAVHWFAGEAFNAEVRRVAKAGALLAWIGYLPLRVAGEGAERLQPLLDHFYGQTLEPWWPPERRWVDQRYSGLPFPGNEWAFPQDLWIERRWDLDQLLGYLDTWSAVQAARASGEDPLQSLAAELRARWPGGGTAALDLRWPFMGRWGCVT